MIKRKITTAILSSVLALLVGCGTLQSPQQVSSELYKAGFAEAVDVLQLQASRCWQRPTRPFVDGILVRSSSKKSDPFVLSLNRANTGVGYIEEPFLILTARPAPDGTSISIKEGDFFCGLRSCKSLHLAAHVQKWLAGDLECSEINTSY